MTVPDSPENKCLTCRGRGERYSGGLLGSGWVKCERCGGSGRINTSGDFIGDKPGQGEHSCHENCPCSPSPDRETGECEWTTDAELARDIATGIGGFWDDEPMGEDPPFGPDDVARAVVEVLVEGRLSPSAAPTNSGAGSRSDSEGELRARIEAKAREYEKDAEYADASGHKAAMAQARLLRSLLVPKEEA